MKDSLLEDWHSCSFLSTALELSTVGTLKPHTCGTKLRLTASTGLRKIFSSSVSCGTRFEEGEGKGKGELEGEDRGVVGGGGVAGVELIAGGVLMGVVVVACTFVGVSLS